MNQKIRIILSNNFIILRINSAKYKIFNELRIKFFLFFKYLLADI